MTVGPHLVVVETGQRHEIRGDISHRSLLDKVIFSLLPSRVQFLGGHQRVQGVSSSVSRRYGRSGCAGVGVREIG